MCTPFSLGALSVVPRHEGILPDLVFCRVRQSSDGNRSPMKAIKRIASCRCLLLVTGVIGLKFADAAAPAASALPAKLMASQARHLPVRTGFAHYQVEVNAFTDQSARQAVAEIVRKAEAARPLYPVPTFVAQPPPIPFRLLKSKEEQQISPSFSSISLAFLQPER